MSQTLHDFELALVEPCLAMLERGLRVDDTVRQQMMAALGAELDPLAKRVNERIQTRLAAWSGNGSHLFDQTWRCPNCHNGKKKKLTCATCGGDGRREWREFNLTSEQQKKLVLYEVLRLPRKFKQKKLRSDEEALKNLLAHDKEGIVTDLLRHAKAGTIHSILERLEPAADGRIRTWYNIAGTETGRFSASETFLERSTNLQNLPLKQAARSPLYDVRRCVVPDEGEVFLYADLSQAEARVVAALAGDRGLLDRWDDPAFDVHVWTAANIFSKPEGEITSDERFLGKTARHALNYGEGWATFQRKVNSDADITGVAIDAYAAKQIVAGYHNLHPSLQSWWKRVGHLLDTQGWLDTCFGRRRTFFGRREADHWLDATHREAIAFEPQSTVADLLNRGLLRWWNVWDGQEGARLLAQIHDAILVSVKAGAESFVAGAIRSVLEEKLEINGVRLTIPCEISVGRTSWAALEDLELVRAA